MNSVQLSGKIVRAEIENDITQIIFLDTVEDGIELKVSEFKTKISEGDYVIVSGSLGTTTEKLVGPRSVVEVTALSVNVLDLTVIPASGEVKNVSTSNSSSVKKSVTVDGSSDEKATSTSSSGESNSSKNSDEESDEKDNSESENGEDEVEEDEYENEDELSGVVKAVEENKAQISAADNPVFNPCESDDFPEGFDSYSSKDGNKWSDDINAYYDKS